MAYESTSVSVERSQGQIRALLVEHGASGFAFGEEVKDDRHWALVTFQHDRHRVRMRVPLQDVDAREVNARARRAHTKTAVAIETEMREQEAKRIWRVVHWNLKARLVAVENDVETFEEAFLAHLLDERTGETIYEQLARSGRVELGAPLLPELEAGDEEPVDAEVVG